jgi:hypothetical protein
MNRRHGPRHGADTDDKRTTCSARGRAWDTWQPVHTSKAASRDALRASCSRAHWKAQLCLRQSRCMNVYSWVPSLKRLRSGAEEESTPSKRPYTGGAFGGSRSTSTLTSADKRGDSAYKKQARPSAHSHSLFALSCAERSSASRQAGTPSVWHTSPLSTFGAALPLLGDSRRWLADSPPTSFQVGAPSNLFGRHSARPVHLVPSRAVFTPAAATPSSLPWMSQPRVAEEAADLYPRVAATPSAVERQPAVPLPQLGYGGSRPPLGGMQQLAQVSRLVLGLRDGFVSLTLCTGGLCAQTQQGVDAYIERFRQVRPDAAPEEGQQDQPLFASPPMAVPHCTPQPAGSRLDDGAHQMQA